MSERRGAPAIAAAAAGALLAERFDPAVDRLEPIEHQGLWTRAFTFHGRGRKHVVRFSAIRDDFDVDRLVASWAPPGLPVPAILDIGEAFDGYYAISEWASGTPLELRDEREMRAVLPSLLEALDVLRLIDVSSTRGYGYWDAARGRGQEPSWRAFLLSVGDGARRDLIASSPSGLGSFDECLERLRELVDDRSEDRALVHNDLLYRNVLVEERRVAAILDWGAALFGDFLYDIAVLSFWSAWYTQWSAIDIPREVREHYGSVRVDVPHFNERLRCYELHVGLSGQHFQVSQGRYSDAEWTARRTLELARAPLV